MLRSGRQILLDCLIVLCAALLAFALRDDAILDAERLSPNLPYILATLGALVLIWPTMGLQKQVWRHTGLRDLVWVSVGGAAVIALGLGLGFLVNRLDGVPRAVPPLFLIVATLMLMAARIGTRALYLRRLGRRSRSKAPSVETMKLDASNVLIVGVSPLATSYRSSVVELGAADRIHVVGYLSPKLRHRGQTIDQVPVLGRPEDISGIATDLEVQGMPLDRILVVVPFSSLSDEAREALLAFESSHSVHLQFLVEELGLAQSSPGRDSESPAPTPKMSFHLPEDEVGAATRGGYWRWKRAFDVVLSATLLAALSPVIVAAGVLTGARLGLPLIFSQYRPGRNGVHFRLYKFRTMRAVRTADGRMLNDNDRLDGFGTFMRRTRIDELPQLWNILIGQMSFVGPRPLLPCDQDPAWRARLVVRPGLTGWAQVVGGREVSAEDKAALDVWYVRNASFALDLEIAARTLPMLFKGERISRDLIARAWSDLRRAGIVMGDPASSLPVDARGAMG